MEMDVFVLGSYVNANSLTVGRLPQAGESVCADGCWVEHGGKGLNLALGMQRLGLNVDVLLAVGHDPAGDVAIQFLQAEGLNTNHVLRLGAVSGFGVGLIATDGSNVIVVYPGANALLGAAHVLGQEGSLAAARLVCAQFEIPQAVVVQAFQMARQRGITTLLNPSPWCEPVPELLALTDILVLNEPEAALLFGLPQGKRSGVGEWLDRRSLSGFQGQWLVVTLAEWGCVAWAQGQAAVHVPAYPVKQLDPTGAGDAFTCGLAHACLAGLGLLEALRFANACGGWVAARQGVLPALPSYAEASIAAVESLACTGKLKHNPANRL